MQIEDMRADHRGAQGVVPEEFLHGLDIVSGLNEVGGEGVAEGVAGSALVDLHGLYRFFDGALDGSVGPMMASFDAASGIDGPVV